MNRALPISLFLACLFLMVFSIVQGQSALSATTALPAGNHSAFLALVLKAPTAATPTATATSTTEATPPTATVTVTAEPTVTSQPTPDAPDTFFLPFDSSGEVDNTQSPSIEIDGNGGIHVAYETYGGRFGDEPEPFYYGYCAANCDSTDDFAVATLLMEGENEFVTDLNLELDPQGRPRLLWASLDTFQYAECNNGNCSNRASWSRTPVGLIDQLTDGSNRMFALDSQGRPRVVYNDDTPGEHGGSYYLFCNANCTVAANWSEVRISTENYERPSLALDANGNPRVAYTVFAETTEGFQTLFGYAQCNSSCQNAGNWKTFRFGVINSLYSSYSLQINASGQPRMALFSGPIDEGGAFEPYADYYFSCNSGCDSQANWRADKIELLSGDTTTYQNLSLALDSQGRPRLAHEWGDGDQRGMYYSWCDANCESGSANWQTKAAELTEELNENEPVEPSGTCGFPTWGVGYNTDLALTDEGDPRMVYDARFLCFTGTGVRTAIAWSRLASLEHP